MPVNKNHMNCRELYENYYENMIKIHTAFSSSNTACTIGVIIAVVAVFDIHIDNAMVVVIKPSINLKNRSWITKISS